MLLFLAVLQLQQQSVITPGAAPNIVAESSKAGPRVLLARKTVEAPTIDGRLDDDVWTTVPVATDFTQNYPHNGGPSTRRTEARVLFVGDVLYVGIRAFDSPDSILAPLMRRDTQVINSDQLQVLIDPFHDRRTAYEFGVTPAGVKFDVYHFDDIHGDMTWDAVWDVAIARDPLGWSAEFRIPLSQLNVSATNGKPATWGINFYRNIGRLQEWSSWAPVPTGEGREVSRFGDLADIDLASSARRREIIPYVSTSVTRAQGNPANPFFERTAFGSDAGVDAKLGLGHGLTFDLTVHPDFGQVEADPSEVNISGVETTFQERRPFFVENGGLFSLSIYEGPDEVLFYPRRIGRAPQIIADSSGGFARQPGLTTILGAAKLSGKTAGGLSLGAMEAVTGAAFADVHDSSGRDFRTLVEPATSYMVVRAQQDLRSGKTALGGMLTAVNRFNLGTTDSVLHGAAYAGSLDFRHRFGGASSGDYEIYGALFASDVRGSAQSIAETQRSSVHYFQRPDADHITYDTLRTSLTGYAARLQVDRPIGRIRYGNAFYTRAPGFEVNDIGIQKVADWSENYTWLGTVQTQPNSVFNNWSMFTNGWAWWTYGGERTFTQLNIEAAGELRNFWGSSLRIGRRLPARTLRLRGGPLLNEDGAWVAIGSFYSPQQNALRVNASYSFLRGHNPGTRSVSFSPTMVWQPMTSVTVTLGPSVTREKDAIFYVAQAGADASPTYVLGALNRTTTSLTSRVDLAFSPTLTLQLYAQPFLSAGAYSDFKEVIAPRAAKYADRFRRFVPELTGKTYSADINGDGVTDFSFDDPAFNVRDYQSNTVMRWEYRPGSTIFFVWSQGRHSDGAVSPFQLSDDARDLFRTAPLNEFLVKVTRWMSF